MSARDSVLQIETILDDIADTVVMLANIDGKLNDIQGATILLGLTESNNHDVAATVQLIEAAKTNRETLERFLFNIKQRLYEYKKNL